MITHNLLDCSTPFRTVAHSLLIVFICVFLSFDADAQSPDDILIIANKGVATDAISIEEVKAIFLKQRNNYKSGGRATPINARKGSALRKAFQEKVLGMDGTQETQYWQEQKIKKGIGAPVELSNTVRAVFSMRGGISYCYRKSYKEGTSKVLLTLP